MRIRVINGIKIASPTLPNPSSAIPIRPFQCHATMSTLLLSDLYNRCTAFNFTIILSEGQPAYVEIILDI